MTKFNLNDSPFYLLIILLALMPFNAKAIAPLIVVLVGFSIIFGERNAWKNKFITSISYTLPLVMLFLWSVISLLWTINMDVTSKDLEHKLSLLVFPLVIPLIKLNRSRIQFLFRVFTISCTLVALICLSGTLYKFLYNIPPIEGIDFSKEFSLKEGFGQIHSLFMHRSYYAMYLCISVWIVTQSLAKTINLNSFKKTSLHFIMLLILILGIVFSESKTGLITLFSLIILFVIFNKKYITKTRVLFFIVFIFVFISLFKNILAERFQSFYEAYKEPFDVEQVYGANSIGSRLKHWEAAIELIKEKPILGYGLGTSKETIRKRNLEKEYTVFTIYNRSYNAHNQFLEMWVELGLIGLFLFLLFFAAVVYRLKNTSILIIGIYIIFIMNYFTEVIFDRQTGIVLVTLISCLISILEKEKQNLKNKNV